MSAIFGLVRWRAPVLDSDLEHMSAALARHGSAASGTVVQGNAGLGHRLQCFTPQDALERQPWVHGDLVLVADARIDDRARLLAEPGFVQAPWLQALVGSGPALETLPDSALILRAYELWGDRCVERLVGTWAFVVWNRAAQCLFAARSPITAPQLVYHASPDMLAFATAPSGLHALGEVPRLLDEQRMVNFIAQTGHSRDDTFFKHVFRLPSGHRLVADAAGVRVASCWSETRRPSLRLVSDAAYRDHFLQLFDQTIADYRRSVTPVASHLSGGLDSSAIAATTALQLHAQGERLQTFTEVPAYACQVPLRNHEYADETELVGAIAAHCPGLDNERVAAPGGVFLDEVDALIDVLEAPVRAGANLLWVARINQLAAARGLSVLLSGQQGNLTISYGSQVRGRLRRLLEQWRRLVAPRPLRQAQAMADSYVRLLDPILARDCAARGWLDRGTPARSGGDWRAEALSAQDMGGLLSATRALWHIDLRLPATDLRLVEFCLSLPDRQFCLDGTPRSLIRRAMHARLPASVLNNRLRGRQASDWLARLARARERLKDDLAQLQQSPLARRFLNVEWMQQLVNELPAVDEPVDTTRAAAFDALQHGLLAGRFLLWFDAGEQR